MALERQMVGVLCKRDADRERDASAPACDESTRARRRLDACTATTAVLLAHVLLHDKLARDDVDLFRLFDLSAHLLERAAARSARAIGFVEHVLFRHQAKLPLRARTAARCGVLSVDSRLRVVVMEEAESPQSAAIPRWWVERDLNPRPTD